MTSPGTDTLGRPRWRGHSHQWAAVAAAVVGAVLVASAPSVRAALAALVYALSITALFAVSATYHRVRWRDPRARQWMRRADHAAIFLFIAGSYTPFALLVVAGPLGTGLLVAVWAGALAGIARELLWSSAPRWLGVSAYVALGWLAVVSAPALVAELGWSLTPVVAGGVLYTLGAVVYARRRPDPWPRSFGYHEVFHALVIAAAALQLAVIALVVIPGAEA
jgi:hemolysin III